MIRKMDVGHAPRLVWHLARLPALALLLALAPVVETVCGTLMLLGLLVSVAFELSGARAHFPFWPMIALSLGFGVVLAVYHALIGLLSR
jgi:hypothetical protein